MGHDEQVLSISQEMSGSQVYVNTSKVKPPIHDVHLVGSRI